ncbi:hypothetical protein EP073_04465 [Geovibrio thiophilus]|uniref:YopX protein domain-containing protein n=1 Tax=Geovibrio thiophilus TaxID=139438 RepID=A0A3R6AXE9_9BACT|nr:YopX family protein [Geovibrio thiophilus]QAR32688.1 hypothetical protein EP073_04465 [Geovibrio thiophilus]
MKIKFRAWFTGDIELGKTLKFIWCKTEGDIRLVMENDEEISYSLEMVLLDDDWIKELFVGLKDINGKEIYEGDIVRFNQSGEIFEVKYDGQAFYLDNLNISEIIGNIHEEGAGLR